MERTLEKFSEKLCEGLPEGSTCLYGSFHIQYLTVLVPLQGRMLVIGQLSYNFWYRGFYLDPLHINLLEDFKIALLDSYNEQLKAKKGSYCTIPSLGHKGLGNVLIIDKSISVLIK